MDSGRSDDELARTATANGTTPRAPDAPLVGDSLGRYRLQRELGAGGMGVVHAAFDPDLERRIALKVLRAAGGLEARQRLLREARAMARLAHTNVVTVHEVGSAGGRDFIAMELIDGGTLEDWLRSEPRRESEVIASFVAAGRGLAAAHAAGLVHRDFKPRNVLRQKDGRIVVTDFGLVIGVENQGSVALETTLRIDQKPSPSASDETTPSSLSGLTKTGSVLGTPAYMAPEQWSGAAVGPKADQFAFCIALWEALAGTRPFKGTTIEEQKASVTAGPRDADDSKLPRRLRRPLRRGLDPDPEKRWPSMNALLAAITRRESRPGVALAIGGGALVLAGVAVAMFARGDDGPTCEVPVLDPTVVWSADRAAKLRAAEQGPTVDAIDADMASFRAVRERACAAPAGTREPRLACLDGVIARIELVATAAERATNAPRLDAGELLISPLVCEAVRPPRLIHASSEQLHDVTTAMLEATRARVPVSLDRAKALIAKSASEPCALAYANLFGLGDLSTSDRMVQLEDADRAAQRCGDDRIVSEIMLATAQFVSNDRLLDAEAFAKLRRAEAAAEKVMQPDLEGDLDLMRATLASRNDRIDEAIAWANKAVAAYDARKRTRVRIGATLAWITYRELRGHVEDLAAQPHQFAELRAEAAKAFGETDQQVREIDRTLALRDFVDGNVAAAHAKLEALRDPMPIEKPIKISGRVVDEAGVPVAGAVVMASSEGTGDSVSIMLPGDDQRSATSGPDGTFLLPEAVSEGVIIAQKGDLRSAAQKVAEAVTLTLQPTSRLEGKVELHGEPSTLVGIGVRDQSQPINIPYAIIGTPRADGTFVIDGVPRGKVLVQTSVARSASHVINGIEVAVTQPVVKDVALEVKTSKRIVHVIVRSQYGGGVTAAQVVILPGTVASSNALAINQTLQTVNFRLATPILGEQAPKPVLAQAKLGDLYATMGEAPEGAASACAVGLPRDMDKELTKKVRDPKNMAKIAVTCVPLAPSDNVVTVEVPPFPRFD